MAMPPERWRQIEDIFNGALERERGARRAYVENACGGDETLRGEVEALLQQDGQGGQLLSAPIEQVAGEVLGGSSEFHFESGSMAGPYRIGERLGAGGMGEVYRAQDTRLNRTVAIKTLKARFTERFEREARAISALNHPHICTLYDIGSQDGVGYLVMEYVEGEALKGPLPVPEALRLGIQIAGALEAAHEKGILHRDLKPGNILVSKGGVKLLDFGLAKFVPTSVTAGPRTAEDTVTTPLTGTGQILGTLAYMSPEQIEGKAADVRSDIFSFGLVLYEMLTGRRAFEASSQAGLMAAILKEDPPPLMSLLPSIPAALDRMVRKCLAKEPARRWQTASDLRDELAWIAEGDSAAKRWKAIVPVAAGVLAILAASYFYFHRTPKLTDKDTIVLADFVNTTGDPVFDGALRQGLAVQLEQSPFLSLISDKRIQKALSLMGQPADAPLTPEIAREICERTASAAVLDGSIAPLGSQFVLGLRAKNCRTGEVLDEEQVEAAKKEDVLNALSQIASKFRTRVGESLATVKSHDTPLAEATTSSLEALKAYSAGVRADSPDGGAAARPLFKRAVEIDPQFAMAHAWLGILYSTIGESTLAAESTRKAYQLRDRVSDREKFFITASYEIQVTGNLEKAQRICEEWAQTYPRELNPHGFLAGMVYPILGKYEKGAAEAGKAIGIDPDFAVGYYQLAFHYTYLDRLGEAGDALQRASARKLVIPEFSIQRYDIAFIKNDQAGMEREATLSRGNSALEDWLSQREAFVLAYSGHLKQARLMSRRAADLARQTAQLENAALYETGAALWEALIGNAFAARRGALAALEISKNRDVQYGAAFALALAGDSVRAQTLANDLEGRFPEDTAVKFSYVPAIRALLALNHGEPAKAVELLQIAVPYDLGGPPCAAPPGYFGMFYPVYVRGLAYLDAHQGAEAAVEFQKIIDHRAIVISDPIGALAHLQLGRAFKVSGDNTKAKAAYQDFFSLWKDADHDIPILIKARKEYDKLP
jgi:eukaryotic-like serine/threonine-protein kinase